ncbi:hypothetical protein DPEC_G00295040 [Dallia pectoralis]|uniref:Uncharacterized protein n=1 Tax=Dallia pectoralis TaxID=75939 RepID=A0ACC2FIU6_DALPE|nr:hypothetical protein DPEC_G00295040 [Dallia pectoralis]
MDLWVHARGGAWTITQEAWTRGGGKNRTHQHMLVCPATWIWREAVGVDPCGTAALTHEYKATSSHTGPVKGFPLRPGLIVSTGQLMCVEGSVLYATVLAAGAQIVWGYGGPDS